MSTGTESGSGKPADSSAGRLRDPAALRRLWLLAFTALAVALFLIVAIGEGIGHPSVPSGAVALVEDVPEDLGTVTAEELDLALAQAAAAGQLKPVPKPGDQKYDELREAALGEVLDTIWIQGQAEEMGISATRKEIEKELREFKDQAFKTERQYREFLEGAKYTRADVLERVKVRMLSTQIQEQAEADRTTPSKDEIDSYYEDAKSTEYTTPESRDVRVVENSDRASVETARKALEKDRSEKNWEEVAKKYSTDSTKDNGGLRIGVRQETLDEPLDAAVFIAPQGAIEGPLREGQTYVVFEVAKITPEKVMSLDEVEAQISARLSENAQRTAFNAFVANFNSVWTSRTFCASDVATPRCANFKSDSHPTEASPACYEADPEAAPEACPAPVLQVKPAVPGSVSLLTPEGRKLAQRPQPANPEQPAE